MRRILNKNVIFVLVVVVLLSIFSFSACNILGQGEEPPPGPSQSTILAPADQSTVLAGSPLQVQSAHLGANISRIELAVQREGADIPTLIRADNPVNGVVTQQWIPDETGLYTVRVTAFDANDQIVEPALTPIQVRVVQPVAVQVSSPQPPPVASPQPPPATATAPAPGQPTAPPAGEAAAFQAPGQNFTIVQVATVTPEPAMAVVTPTSIPSPTPTPFYPPPPPVPGVPPGPLQEQLPLKRPPVCDAADFAGVFTGNTSQRIQIAEPDQIPAKTVGGATVFRAWRLQNTGTCTWGPGYELAFYGGRSMGSGGVAFESTFPGDPGRRNVIIDRNRLVVPEGKPNQVAVVEVLLNAPVTPGIHQSYWRMRNPQGVFFGPILGVTLEVVRDCQFGIYGAPVINDFVILGVGDVFRPENPVDVQATFGETVTLDWNIINVTNLDIVLESPTGEISTISSGDPIDRASFRPRELGEYTITLYADNGPCTVTAEVTVDVVPPDDVNFFTFDVIGADTRLSSSGGGVQTTPLDQLDAQFLAPGQIQTQWRHMDEDVDRLVLTAQRYKRTRSQQCAFGLEVPDILRPVGLCEDDWSAWVPDETGQPLPAEIVAVNGGETTPEFFTPPIEIIPPDEPGQARTPEGLFTEGVRLGSATVVRLGNQAYTQGSASATAKTVGEAGDAQGSAVVTNVEWGLCPPDTPSIQYGIRYVMRAEKDGRPASPQYSNAVDVRCGSVVGSVTPRESLDAAGSRGEFNPD